MSTKTIKDLSTTFKPEIVSTKGKLVKINVTSEENIIDQEINKIKKRSDNLSELTLEDIKKLDLLIKNKRLLNDESTLNADFTTLPEGTTEDDLMKIAGSKEDVEAIGSNESPSSQDPLE